MCEAMAEERVVRVAAALLVGGTAAAQAPQSIKIGWAISKTGPYAGGASITTLPNYQLWVKDVNEAGGIMLAAATKRADRSHRI